MIFGLPRPGGPHYPVRNIDEQAQGAALGHWTTRVIIFAPDRYAVLDVVAKRDGSREWSIVEVRDLFVVVS